MNLGILCAASLLLNVPVSLSALLFPATGALPRKKDTL